MAIRILPFRQYAEQDVVNLYALKGTDVNDNLATKGNGDAGVFVSVSNGKLDDGPVTYASSSYLGKTDYPYVGRDQYPSVQLRAGAASTGDSVLGMTLNQTALKDENGEKLLYYPQKALENQTVLSGQAVPVLTRGVVALNGSAGGDFGNNAYVDDTNWAIGNVAIISPNNDGRLSGVAPSSSRLRTYSTTTSPGQDKIGVILATGSRVAGATADQFAGAAGTTGAYAIVKIDCN